MVRGEMKWIALYVSNQHVALRAKSGFKRAPLDCTAVKSLPLLLCDSRWSVLDCAYLGCFFHQYDLCIY